jgi:hypothetical protein
MDAENDDLLKYQQSLLADVCACMRAAAACAVRDNEKRGLLSPGRVEVDGERRVGLFSKGRLVDVLPKSEPK